MLRQSAVYSLCSIWIAFCLLLAGCGGNSPFQDDLAEARNAVQEGDIMLAEKYLERYLRNARNPDRRWDAWNELIAIQQYDRSSEKWILEELETMLSEYESNPKRTAEILYQLAEISEKAGHADAAIRYWARYISQENSDPLQNALAHRKLAALHFRRQHFADAEKILRTCLDLPVPDSIHAQCLFDLASNAESGEHLAEAQQFARQILTMSGAEADIKSRAAFLIADIQEQQGQTEAAMETFQSIKESYPNPLAVDMRINHLKKKK